MAYVKISSLPESQALDGSELVPIVQGGVTSQTSIAAIKAQGNLSGRATLVAGTATVTTAAVTSLSNIQLTGQDSNVTGALNVSARTAGTSFTITSSEAGDSGVVAWSLAN